MQDEPQPLTEDEEAALWAGVAQMDRAPWEAHPDIPHWLAVCSQQAPGEFPPGYEGLPVIASFSMREMLPSARRPNNAAGVVALVNAAGQLRATLTALRADRDAPTARVAALEAVKQAAIALLTHIAQQQEWSAEATALHQALRESEETK